MAKHLYPTGPKAIRRELKLARKNQNTYGGNEAEIYRYRVLGFHPFDNVSDADNIRADAILDAAIARFRKKHRRAIIIVDGCFADPECYRLHVTVYRNKALILR